MASTALMQEASWAALPVRVVVCVAVRRLAPRLVSRDEPHGLQHHGGRHRFGVLFVGARRGGLVLAAVHDHLEKEVFAVVGTTVVYDDEVRCHPLALRADLHEGRHWVLARQVFHDGQGPRLLLSFLTIRQQASAVSLEVHNDGLHGAAAVLAQALALAPAHLPHQLSSDATVHWRRPQELILQGRGEVERVHNPVSDASVREGAAGKRGKVGAGVNPSRDQ